ncbi:MAG: hypothetical protein AAF492_10115, partial [Verrucomicrobiota bacterium]
WPWGQPKDKAQAYSKKKKFNLKPDADLDRFKAPFTVNKTLSITAELNQPGGEGVIFAHGGSVHGYALYIKDDAVHFAVRRNSDLDLVSSHDSTVKKAKRFSVRYAKNGEVELSADGRTLTKKKTGGSLSSHPADGLQVGRDLAGRVGAYKDDLPFTGKIRRVLIDVQ